MSLAFVQELTTDAGIATNVSSFALPSISIGAGRLFFGFIKWENTATPLLSITNSGAPQAWVLGNVQDGFGSTQPHIQWFWCLSTLADAALIITANWASATANWQRGRAAEYSTTIGAILQAQIIGANALTPPNAVATIGPFSTAQAVELVAIGAGFDTGQNFTITPPTIDGVTATIRGTGTATDTCMATNITSAQINNGSAVITGSVTPGAWSMNGVAFKEQSSGPTLWAQGMV